MKINGQFLHKEIDFSAVIQNILEKGADWCRGNIMPRTLILLVKEPLASASTLCKFTFKIGHSGSIETTPIPLPDVECGACVLLAVNEADILSFEIPLSNAGVSVHDLLDNNFEAYAPFKRDEAYIACRRFNAPASMLSVRYVPKRLIDPTLQGFVDVGQIIDGLALSEGSDFTVLIDRKSFWRRMILAKRDILLGGACLLLAVGLMASLLDRQSRLLELRKAELAAQVSELQSRMKPGNPSLMTAASLDMLDEARRVIACLQATLPAETVLREIELTPDGGKLRFARGSLAGIANLLIPCGISSVSIEGSTLFLAAKEKSR